MRATTILAIVAIVAAIGAVASLVPVQQVSAQVVGGGGPAQGPPLFPPGQSRGACAQTLGHSTSVPFCGPAP